MVEGLALALELLEPSSSSSSNVIHSAALLTASSVAGLATLIPRNWGSVVYCDSTTVPGDDWQHGRWTYGLDKYGAGRTTSKSYTVELKPLFSAFTPKTLASTSLKALIVNFMPILEAYMNIEEDDEERPADPDMKTALRRSGTYAFREVSVVTVRRVLERIAVHLVSARTAWKLLKDVPKSASRKARRSLSKLELFDGVAKTTFRAHALGIGANWLVQELLDMYRSGKVIYIHRKNAERAKGNQRELEVLYSFGRKTAGNTLKALAALTCASIGAGCGAVLITPHTGTWIGLALGDFGGTFLVGLWLDPWIYQP